MVRRDGCRAGVLAGHSPQQEGLGLPQDPYLGALPAGWGEMSSVSAMGDSNKAGGISEGLKETKTCSRSAPLEPRP